jgi:uncharacterized protein DUF4254
MRNADVPTVAEVVAALGRAEEAGDDGSAGLLGVLLGLHANNLAQWKLEDAARDPAASDAVVARAKRDIDRLNRRRHDFVEQIDDVIDGAIAQTTSAPPTTESPGMAFDRLSVLVIRLHHTEAASRSPTPDAGLYAARLPALREHLASLVTAVERLLRDLQDGERSFLPYRHLKLYRSSADPVTPASRP